MTIGSPKIYSNQLADIQGGDGTWIPNRGLKGEGLVGGPKQKSDLPGFDGGSGRWRVRRDFEWFC